MIHGHCSADSGGRQCGAPLCSDSHAVHTVAIGGTPLLLRVIHCRPASIRTMHWAVGGSIRLMMREQ
jgi:hypothetical protein